MEHTNRGKEVALKPIGADFVKRVWEESWTYIKTVVDIVREPVLILDKDLRVMAANESFYRTFQVELKDTEKQIVYKLGNGQWDIPALKKLLEDILPKNTFLCQHNLTFSKSSFDIFTSKGAFIAICRALAPRILAVSYFVKSLIFVIFYL